MSTGLPLSPETRSVLDQAACGLLQTDSSGVVLRANRTFCNWLGYAEADLVGQRRLQDLLTMGGRIFHQTHWAPLMQMQGSVSEVKLEMVHRDGHSVPMVMNALRHHTGGAVVDDIAAYVARDRDKYERQLVESRKRLEEAVAQATRLQDEAKDRALFAEQMVGIVSHDLRNPLSSIQMAAVLLTRGEATPSQVRVLGRISRATERAVRLIADLLDFTQARLGTGLAVTRTQLNLHGTVGDVVEELALAFPGRQLVHRREGEGDCRADADRLAQMVGNLVANAVAYGRNDAPVVVITEVASQTFTVAVHNEGPAIPAETLPVLFTPMARGDAHSGAARSVGLGLFIVSEIVKAHGGHVAVRSDPTLGTTFSAEFPRG